MPDVTRSDSQRSHRSDTSLKPRVSFNRDVHVKRIVPRESARVAGAVSGEEAGGQFVGSPVRKERLRKSKKELAEEAARVLHQVDRLDCVTTDSGEAPDKFYTLPHRKKHKEHTSPSIDRRSRSGSLEQLPPRKPPRTFATVVSPPPPQKTSIFDIFKKDKKSEPKKSNLRRSVSDATNLKSKVYGNNDVPFRKRSGSDAEDPVNLPKNLKKQLSTITEVSQQDYYGKEDKENIHHNDNVDLQAPVRKKNKKESVTEQLKEYIDEVDEELYKETGIRVSPKEEIRHPQPIIIDVEKAEKISTKNKKFSIGKKFKSITHKKNKINEASNKIKKPENKKGRETKPVATSVKTSQVKEETKIKPEKKVSEGSVSPSPRIKSAIETLENSNNRSPTMIHSSQKPVEKLPLTKGRTVDTMVKRLSSDSCSPPPPKTNVLISPHASVQHNNNQPFSYTRGLSPEKYLSNEQLPNSSSPIIYAQVVCGGNSTGPAKQTVHTAFTNGKKHPHSDSDEGLGGEENSGFSRLDKPVITRFVKDRYIGESYRKTHDYYDEVDKFDEESPITPKFRSPAYLNGFTSYERKTEQSGYIDSSSRGRGDGMDAKRRESLSEPHENGFGPKLSNGNMGNSRTDLSARRDLLESRINRRLNDNLIRTSPEYLQKSPTPTNVYISETSSKYYRGGSTSPVGYKEKYISETRTDRYGKPHTTESKSKQYFGDPKEAIEYDNRVRVNGYQYSSFENEPKSFDSQISDYRSSPENRQFEASHNKSNTRYNVRSENQKILKSRDLYKSTPEIHQRKYQGDQFHDSYHDSLRREKTENRITTTAKYRSERYLDHSENERKDKFVDSGIENDFRRDSGDNFTRPIKSRRDYCNESEDEGFASSLLIASERQHTEDNFNQRRRRGYDSDRAYSREDDPYRNIESMEYKSKLRSSEYAPRERSIDDGSHYDPRIDKDVDTPTLKRLEKKPPKPEKKSGLEKVKSLFTRDSKKKKDKQQPGMVREESLRARYTEYKGAEVVEPKIKKKDAPEPPMSYDYSNRRRLSTPSPSPTREVQRNGKSETTHGSWFKSLDRLSRKKTKKDEKEGNLTSGTEEDPTPTKAAPTKSLRFFGDTDIESNDSVRHRASPKPRPGITHRDRTRSQSSKDLHNISEELKTPDLTARKNSHKSMLNISETDREKGSRVNLKPPMSPNHRTPREVVSRQREDRDRGRRRKNEVSSVESSTEGDSSQQSQRSIVYLHAATVGDIPGPGYLRNGRRAASREELASNGSSRIQPQVKTLSRSFSVLAPWKPRHPREGMDIDYTQYPKKNGKYEQKVAKTTPGRKDSSSTLKKKAQESKKNQNNSTLNRKSKSKENLSSSQALRRSREELSKGSSSTLYKKKDKLPRENSRYNRERDDKKIASKSLSVESLGSNGRNRRNTREETRDISRSVSMPRDPEKSAGWFKMTKKNKSSGSTQRL